MYRFGGEKKMKEAEGWVRVRVRVRLLMGERTPCLSDGRVSFPERRKGSGWRLPWSGGGAAADRDGDHDSGSTFLET